MLWVLGIFVVVNALISVFSVENSALLHGSDVGTWYRPALGLLKYGGYVDPDDPTKYMTVRPPLYPTLIALLLALTGTIQSVIVAQITLLFATGLVARRITEALLPGYGMLVMALVVFNPSAIGNAHVIGSDTIYAFVFTGLFWSLLVFSWRVTWQTALVSGAMLGISLLTRNPLEPLLPAWPLVMMVLAMIAQGRGIWKRALLLGIGATVLAYAITVPWLAYNYHAGEGFGQTTDLQKAWFITKQIVYLEHCHTGLPRNIDRDNTFAGRKQRLRQIPNFDSMPERKRARLEIAESFAEMRNYSVKEYVCALAGGWALMYGSPGVANLSLMFGLISDDTIALLRWNRFGEYFLKTSLLSIAITAVGLIFLVLVRILNLIGFVAMVRRRAWLPLVTIIGAMIPLTLILLFNGASRFRLPLDPMLFLVAAYGVAEIRERWIVRAAKT